MSIWQLNSSRATIYHHHSVYFWGSVSHNISQDTAANQRGNDSTQAQCLCIWYFYLLLSDRAVIFFPSRQSTTPTAELKVCLATQRDSDWDLFPIISLLAQGWNEQPLSCHMLSSSLCYINTYISFLLKFFSYASCKWRQVCRPPTSGLVGGAKAEPVSCHFGFL